MPYAAPFVRVSFGGETAGGNEIWSCGFAIIGWNPSTVPLTLFEECTAKITDVGDDLVAFFANQFTRVPADAKLQWLKMALIGTDGKYMYPAEEIELNQAGYWAQGYSPQDAFVFTLDSGKWKDPGKYNRFYLPTVGASDAGNYKLTETEQTQMIDVFKGFIDAVNLTLDHNNSTTWPVVGVVSNTGTGLQFQAEKVKLGQIVDTQRRRRNALSEAYQTRDIPFAP